MKTKMLKIRVDNENKIVDVESTTMRAGKGVKFHLYRDISPASQQNLMNFITTNGIKLRLHNGLLVAYVGYGDN